MSVMQEGASARSREPGLTLHERTLVPVLGVPIDQVTWDVALRRLHSWARDRESRYVCICNVHSVVTASRSVDFMKVVSEADLATPDGAPVAWMIRKLGSPSQARINGPDLMWRYLEEASKSGEGVFLYGGAPATLERLAHVLRERFPGLVVAGTHSPPFRALSAEEDAAEVEMLNASGAGVVFVSLGCPKQEVWMHQHRGRINAVMVGVGAAFDYHAGTIKRAPQWMQDSGLEWLYRLLSEPRRLWKRYLYTNTIFVFMAVLQLVNRGRTASRTRG